METSDSGPGGKAQSSSSALKRTAEQSLDMDDDEPLSKLQAVGPWGSAEEFSRGYLGLFSSGIDGMPELEKKRMTWSS